MPLSVPPELEPGPPSLIRIVAPPPVPLPALAWRGFTVTSACPEHPPNSPHDATANTLAQRQSAAPRCVFMAYRRDNGGKSTLF
jgi:hypothetical protein